MKPNYVLQIILFMKKPIVLLLAFLAFSLSVIAGNPGVTLLLCNGQKVSFAFYEKPVVNIHDAELTISVSGVERVSYAYADVQRVVVEDDVVSVVKNAVANDESQHVVFNLSANSLSVLGLTAGEQIALYAVDGKLMLSGNAGVDGTVVFGLSALQQGSYVVHTQSGISYKLFKK